MPGQVNPTSFAIGSRQQPDVLAATLVSRQTIGSGVQTNLTGMTLRLSPGTWVIFGQMAWRRAADGAVEGAIKDDLGNVVAQYRGQVNSTFFEMTFPLTTGILTPARWTTYQMVAWTNGANNIVETDDNNLWIANSGGATRMTAIRIQDGF